MRRDIGKLRQFTTVLTLTVLMPFQVLAWDQQLIDAANRIAMNSPNRGDMALILAKNYEINLMGMKGVIDDNVYQICQNQFEIVSRRLGENAAKKVGVSFSVQARKPGELAKPFKAGTDQDYITGATSAKQVREMKEAYNEEFTEYLNKKLNASVDPGTDWTKSNDIDFMGDPKNSTDLEFRKMADQNNAAYTSTGAARYEASSRIDGGGRIALNDTVDYVDEMQKMIEHRQVELTKQMKDFDEVNLKLSSAAKGTPEHAALINQRLKLDAEIFKNRALQAKYVDRINTANKNLRQWLPEYTPFNDWLPDNQKIMTMESGSPLTSKTVVDNAAKRQMLNQDSLIDSYVFDRSKDKIIQLQMQENIEVMAAISKHHPDQSQMIHDAIRKYSNLLDASQTDEVIAAIRRSSGDEIAERIAKVITGEMGDPEFLVRRLYKQLLPKDEYDRVIKSLDDGNFEDLPASAKKIRNQVAETTAYRRTSLKQVSGDELAQQFQRGYKGVPLGDEAKKTLNELASSLDQTSSAAVQTRVLGEELGGDLITIKKHLTPDVKASLAEKLSPRVSLKEMQTKWYALRDQKALTELGDSTAMLGLEGVIGLAMSLYEIDQIMDKNLTPEEESRQLTNAVVTNMPIVGDFLMSGNMLGEAVAEGSYSKGAMSAAYLVIGIGGLVPGAQLPALVAGLGMGATMIGAAAWDLSIQKDTIWAWVASGNWDDFESNQVFRSGKMVGLIDINGVTHAFGKPRTAKEQNLILLEQFILNGGVYYHAPFRLSTHTSGLPDVTIRDSIYDVSEMTVLKGVKEYWQVRDALLTQYPEFDIDKEVRKPLNAGRSSLLGEIRAFMASLPPNKRSDPGKSVAFTLFSDLKSKYDMAAVEAVKMLRHDAEAEYQAAFNYGEAKATIERLQQLEVEYRFPFLEQVDAINDDVLKFFTELAKSPLEKYSIPRRRIELAKEYVQAYDIVIRQSIQRIEKLFITANVNPPSKMNPYNLTGYKEADLERIANLQRAYTGAPKTVTDDIRLKSTLDPNSQCIAPIYKEMLSNRLRYIHTDDVRLLYEEWAGRRNAATEERDAVLRELDAQRAASGPDSVFTIPEMLWTRGAEALGNLYAWDHLTVSWGDQVFGFDTERSYLQATVPLRERMEKLDREYAEILARLEKMDMSACMARMIVNLRSRDPDGMELPIDHAEVTVRLPNGSAIPLQQSSENDYRANLPPIEGSYVLTISHPGYRAEDGRQVIERQVAGLVPVGSSALPEIRETVYMVPVPLEVTISVVDDRGDAVPEAELMLIGSNWRSGNLRAVDDYGLVRLNDVPPGEYQLEAIAPGYQPLQDRIRILADDPVNGAMAHQEIELTPFLSTVVVTVSDATDEWIEGAQVTLKGKWLTDIVDSDAGGDSYFYQIPPAGGDQAYELTVQKTGYATATASIDVLPGEADMEFEVPITLEGGVQVQVNVVHDETGNELPGAAVQLSFLEQNLTATSDLDGVALFEGVTPSFVYISAVLPGFQAVASIEHDLRFSDSNSIPEFTIRLVEGMKVTAYVMGPDGQLLPSGYVSMDGGPFLEAPTGSVEFSPVKRGIHEFRARARQYVETSVFYDADPAANISDSVNLQLAPGATIMVEVRGSEQELLRTAGSEITLFFNGEPIETSAGPLKLFAGLAPGIYHASARANGYTSGLSREIRYSGSTPEFHDTLQVTLQSVVQSSALRVVVDARNRQGSPVMSGAKIEVIGPTGTLTEHDLIGSFSGLVPGEYMVRASVDGFNSDIKSIFVAPDQPGKVYSLFFDLAMPAEPQRLCRLEIDIAYIESGIRCHKGLWNKVPAMTAGETLESYRRRANIGRCSSSTSGQTGSDDAQQDSPTTNFKIELGGPSGWMSTIGDYAVFENLPAGNYQLNVHAPGWENSKRSLFLCGPDSYGVQSVSVSMARGESSGSSISN